MPAPVNPPYAAPRTPSPPSDNDAPFKNTVNGFGIYQPQDQLAWLGKITCDRLGRGVDHDAYASANFIQQFLKKDGVKNFIVRSEADGVTDATTAVLAMKPADAQDVALRRPQYFASVQEPPPSEPGRTVRLEILVP